ncbi:MAG: hypothetical protein QM479_15095 [Pseudomonadota bacterium]
MHKLIKYFHKSCIPLIPDYIKTTFYALGYISLLGPPRSIEIKNQSAKNYSELSLSPLAFILVAETAMRASLFLIIGVSLEYFMGDAFYELYQLDFVLGCFIVMGLIHISFYYLGIILFLPKNYALGMRLYRLGRNITYAILPAFFAAIIALLIQNLDQIEPFTDNFVEYSFAIVFFVFSVLGIVESITQKGTASCLGDINKKNTIKTTSNAYQKKPL